MTKRTVLLGGGALCGGGIALLAVALSMANPRYQVLAYWPEAEAVVTASEAAPSPSAEGRIRIRVRYFAYGEEYRASVLGEGELERYAPGSSHRIRYNPTYPGDIRFGVGYRFDYFRGPVLVGAPGLAAILAGLVVIRRSIKRAS